MLSPAAKDTMSGSGGLCFAVTVPLPQSRLCPGKPSTAATVPRLQPPSSTAGRPASISCPGLLPVCILHFQAPSQQPRGSEPFQGAAEGERRCPRHPRRGDTHHMAEGHDSEQGLAAGLHHGCREAGQQVPQQGKDMQGGGRLLGACGSRATSQPVTPCGKALPKAKPQ